MKNKKDSKKTKRQVTKKRAKAITMPKLVSSNSKTRKSLIIRFVAIALLLILPGYFLFIAIFVQPVVQKYDTAIEKVNAVTEIQNSVEISMASMFSSMRDAKHIEANVVTLNNIKRDILLAVEDIANSELIMSDPEMRSLYEDIKGGLPKYRQVIVTLSEFNEKIMTPVGEFIGLIDGIGKDVKNGSDINFKSSQEIFSKPIKDLSNVSVENEINKKFLNKLIESFRGLEKATEYFDAKDLSASVERISLSYLDLYRVMTEYTKEIDLMIDETNIRKNTERLVEILNEATKRYR